MMKVKTSDLIGTALDWAVAKCEGKYFGDVGHGLIYVHNHDGTLYCSKEHWCPSTNWAQGGPIIEREKISIYFDDGDWYACHPRIRPKSKWWRNGPTALIAALRCYVTSKLGDEMDVPDELLWA